MGAVAGRRDGRDDRRDGQPDGHRQGVGLPLVAGRDDVDLGWATLAVALSGRLGVVPGVGLELGAPLAGQAAGQHPVEHLQLDAGGGLRTPPWSAEWSPAVVTVGWSGVWWGCWPCVGVLVPCRKHHPSHHHDHRDDEDRLAGLHPAGSGPPRAGPGWVIWLARLGPGARRSGSGAAASRRRRSRRITSGSKASASSESTRVASTWRYRVGDRPKRALMAASLEPGVVHQDCSNSRTARSRSESAIRPSLPPRPAGSSTAVGETRRSGPSRPSSLLGRAARVAQLARAGAL